MQYLSSVQRRTRKYSRIQVIPSHRQNLTKIKYIKAEFNEFKTLILIMSIAKKNNKVLNITYSSI